MNCKAIIFDLDGTLLDTLEDIADAANRTLASRGYPTHNTAAYKNFVGGGAQKLIERILPGERRNTEEVAKCLEGFIQNYNDGWNSSTRLYDGIPEMLDQLAALDIKLAILSNKPHEFTLRSVSAYLGRWRFEPVLGQRPAVAPKPDPAGALQIVNQLALATDNFLYLGDTGIDMHTAAAAGITPVGALWGFRSEQELTEAGARYLLKHPAELLTHL